MYAPDIGAGGVDRQGRDGEAVGHRDVPVLRLAVALDRQAGCASVAQHLAQEAEAAAEAGAYDDAVRAGPHAADAGEVAGQHLIAPGGPRSTRRRAEMRQRRARPDAGHSAARAAATPWPRAARRQQRGPRHFSGYTPA